MRGTVEQARAYCTKEETRDPDAGFGITEFGDQPVGQGSRSDLEELAFQLQQGKRGRELFELVPSQFLRNVRGVAVASAFYESERDWDTEVHWYFGTTGSGKSRAAREENEGAYWKSCDDFWWDGYAGQEVVVIDDYRKDFCKFSQLLRLFDRYPLRLQVKGGTVSFVARKIVVTSPFSPAATWSQRSEEDVNQLLRRITRIVEFPIVVNEN
jgi:hypothetical protein